MSALQCAYFVSEKLALVARPATTVTCCEAALSVGFHTATS